MTSPSPTQPQIDWQEVADELCAEPLGRALFERAQAFVLARQQAARIAELEAVVRDSSAA